MSEPTRGTFGHGLLERLDAVQFEIDDLVAHIGRSIRENNLKIIVDDDGNVPMEAITDPQIGTVVRVARGSRPQWVTPQAVAPQDIQWLKELIGWLYQVAGMDEGAASQQRPAGLNSGRALQFYHDFQSLRYADLSKRLAQHVLDTVERIIDAARRLAGADQSEEDGTDRRPGWTVRYARGSETREIAWSEVDMDRDAFVIELEEASAFPDTLAGRMQQVEQDAAEGRVAPEALAQLRLDPDLEARWDRQAADADFVDWLVERLLGEQALEITDTLVRTGAIDLIVVDSVAALTPRAEIEGDMGDSHMGLQARLMSQALRKLTAVIARTRTVVIFINQLRQKIGVVYGNPETTTGVNALKFSCSVRLDIRSKKAIKRGEETVGSEVKVKVVKNKLAPPFREADFEILYGTGVNKLGELVDTAEKLGLVEKSGTWYSYEGAKLGQGRDKAMSHLDEHPALQQQLRAALIAAAKRASTGQALPPGQANGHASGHVQSTAGGAP